MTTRIAIISPHPDDCALSLGGVLARLPAVAPLIITCFSESCSVTKADAGVTTKVRSLEDEAYAGEIGAKLVRLGLSDSSIRTNVGRSTLRPDEESRLRAQLLVRLRDIVRAAKAETVFSPLAIGDHADHVHCRQVAPECCDHASLLFYEDLPYAQFEGGPQRVRRAIRSQFPHLREQVIPLTRAQMQTKLQRLDFYPSQIHPQWRKDVETYAAALGQDAAGAYAERLWSLSPPLLMANMIGQ